MRVLSLTLFVPWLLPGPTAAVSLSDYPQLRTFVEDMANKHAMAQQQLSQWFERATIRQDILHAINTPKEALPWYEYRKLFVTKQSASRGQRFWLSNADALSRAWQDYGVDPATIVAIVGIETQYGRNPGGFRVMDALTTLMLEYPKRSEFFRRELEEYLLLLQELNMDPFELPGSYAGAIGIPQFIPSSYRQYAIDFDGDGQRNIVRSVADSIGSVANFLKRHGWQKGGGVIEQIRLQGEFAAWLDKLDGKPMPSLRYLVSYGILPMRYNDVDQRAALIRLEDQEGPVYYLGYNNFYVITRYNRSQNYAMAVYELSEWIRRLHKANAP
ncbi:MAG: lytic murein transglycosylase B [Acidiferrobacterales bacterium]